MILQTMTLDDLNRISNSLNNFDDFWTIGVFKEELNNTNTHYIIAIDDNNIVGFGGISVHLQGISGARNIKPRYRVLFLWKMIEGITSVVIVYMLLKAFPWATQTINLNGLNVENSGVTPLASITLMLFLITSLAFLQRKLKNYGKRQ